MLFVSKEFPSIWGFSSPLFKKYKFVCLEFSIRSPPPKIAREVLQISCLFLSFRYEFLGPSLSLDLGCSLI